MQPIVLIREAVEAAKLSVARATPICLCSPSPVAHRARFYPVTSAKKTVLYKPGWYLKEVSRKCTKPSMKMVFYPIELSRRRRNRTSITIVSMYA